MKKLLFLLVLIMPILALNAEAKKKGHVTMKVTSSKMNGVKFEKDSVLDLRIDKYGDSFIELIPFNRINEPITIEWEGAKVNYGKLVFDTDRQITMDSQPKSDETIYGKQMGLMRKVTSRFKVGEYGLYPLYKEKDLKKKAEEIKISIPVRMKNGDVRLYEYEILYLYEIED